MYFSGYFSGWASHVEWVGVGAPEWREVRSMWGYVLAHVDLTHSSFQPTTVPLQRQSSGFRAWPCRLPSDRSAWNWRNAKMSLFFSYRWLWNKVPHIWERMTIFIFIHIIYRQVFTRKPRRLSRYSDLLRAGRSGHQIPVEARFFAPVHSGSGAHITSYTMGSEGKVAGGMVLTTHSLPSAEFKERV